MTAIQPGMSVRDSQILELLRAKVDVQRVVEIGAWRSAWTPQHVARMVAEHFTPQRSGKQQPPVQARKPAKPPTPVRPVADCGTIGGYARHKRRKEKPCGPCREARNAYTRQLRAKHAGRSLPPQWALWEPPTYTGAVTDVQLTPARADVLSELCRGFGNASIGRRLGIAPDTVKSHIKDVLAALGARDRT
ncbi:MAG: two component transcriptional regulator, LuxR family, partial [Streptosporangiaceae bacterium]|nr:two component transcriptional regulator, LuxR family [Streptosporangiaceae bacterium]